MRIQFILFFLVSYFTTYSQLEYVGYYAGTSMDVVNYSSKFSEDLNANGELRFSQRIGAELTFYHNDRFSKQVGLVINHSSQILEQYFQKKDNSQFLLRDEGYTNIGIPLSMMARTNLAPKCVTFLKFTLTPFFNLNRKHSYVEAELEKSLNEFRFNYSSLDFDVTFGTFWYLKKIKSKFSLEPFVTLFQHVNEEKAIDFYVRNIVNSHSKVLSRFGFRIAWLFDLY